MQILSEKRKIGNIPQSIFWNYILGTKIWDGHYKKGKITDQLYLNWNLKNETKC